VIKTLNPQSLRWAIAHSPSLASEYAALRNELYNKPIWREDEDTGKTFAIPYNENGDAIGDDGEPLVREYSPRLKAPSFKGLGKVPLPAGMVTSSGLADEYSITMHTLADYMRGWAYKYPDQVVGYCRIDGTRRDGSACARVAAYYDPDKFRAHLLDIRATESGARRMLANVGIGEYHETRGSHWGENRRKGAKVGE